MSVKKQKIGILGSGAWGTALACILNKRRSKTILWGYEKEVSQQINKFKINKTFLPKIRIPNNVCGTNLIIDRQRCPIISSYCSSSNRIGIRLYDYITVL